MNRDTCRAVNFLTIITKYVKAYLEEEELTATLVDGILKIEGENINLTLAPTTKVTYIKGPLRAHFAG